MTPIASPSDLPGGWYTMYLVTDEAQARKVADERECYLFESKIITALYLFVPEIPFTDDTPVRETEQSEMEWMRG